MLHYATADDISTIALCIEEEDYRGPNMTDGIEKTNMYIV
jgi:hypothetical protein